MLDISPSEGIAEVPDSTISVDNANTNNSATSDFATNYAVIKKIWVSDLGNSLGMIIGSEYFPYNLIIELEPMNSILPDQKYLVELYKFGEYRNTVATNWNKPYI